VRGQASAPAAPIDLSILKPPVNATTTLPETRSYLGDAAFGWVIKLAIF